jgi:uncharacterized damage-inducible protein DinB
VEKKYFVNLFKYSEWANKQVYDVIKNEKKIPEKVLELFSHILISQEKWLDRIQTKETEYSSFWEIQSLDRLLKLNSETTQRWLKFLDELEEEDLNKIHAYVNSKGKPFKNTLFEIMTHLVNHGSYHRGQINLVLRQNGLEPAVCDFIVYARG